mgnify:CR=1 FL=1
MPTDKEIHQYVLDEVRQEFAVINKRLDFLKQCILITNTVQAQDLEIQRLKEGRLTPEEFNTLCHNLHENGCPMTEPEHESECSKFRRQLYGPVVMPVAIHSPTLNGDNRVDA